MNKDNLIDWIRKELKRRDWDQEDLSRYAGVSPAQISRMLAGMTQPRIGTINKIADAFVYPRSEVYRIAGLINIEREDKDPRIQRIVTILNNLPEDKVSEILNYSEYVFESGRKRDGIKLRSGEVETTQ